MNINDLMKRYQVKSRQGIRQFILKHLAEINYDGEHAKQTPDGWQFDEEAVRKIDELRGLNQIAFIEPDESERIAELQAENDNLKNLLMLTQADLIAAQKKLIESEQNLLTTHQQLNDNVVVVNTDKQQIATLKEKLELEHREYLELQRQLEELNEHIKKIKNRGLVDRIFNKF